MEDTGAATPSRDHYLRQPRASAGLQATLGGRHIPIVPLQPPEPWRGALASPNPAPAANPA